MAIIGLTNKQAMFPELGTLRKGAPKPQSGPGKDLDYFRFDTDDQEALAAFKQKCGEQPKEIEIVLPFPTTDENFEAWREQYVASGLKHRCDGVNCVQWLRPDGTFSFEVIQCPTPSREERKSGGCIQTGRLKVIIPALERFAYVTVTTTSIHDIIQIHQNLSALEMIRGNLRGIPLILRRVEREISTPAGDGKRARRKKWLITVEAKPEWVRGELAAQRQAAFAPVSPRLALPAWEEDEEEIETIEPGMPDEPLLVDMHTLDAINNLWGVHGSQVEGKIIDLADYLKLKIGITDPRQMTAEQAETTLKWLQKKALDASSLGKKKEKQSPAAQVTKADREAMSV